MMSSIAKATLNHVICPLLGFFMLCQFGNLREVLTFFFSLSKIIDSLSLKLRPQNPRSTTNFSFILSKVSPTKLLVAIKCHLNFSKLPTVEIFEKFLS